MNLPGLKAGLSPSPGKASATLRAGLHPQAYKGKKNRNRFRTLVQSGKVHAVFAYYGDEPVGWCSFGPRHTFPRLDTVKALRHPYNQDTWSIVCFYLPSRWRGKGIATKLLKTATDHAFKSGAKEVEGYPVVPTDKRKPVPAAFAWTGIPTLFKKCGFRQLKNHKASRPIFRKRQHISKGSP